jgi:hypothetical protein
MMTRKEKLIREQNELLKELVQGLEDIKAGRIKPLK